MTEPRRIQTDTQPQAIQKLGNGSYYYNYDIQEIQVTIPLDEGDLDTTTQTQYSFIQVYLKGQPSYQKCVQAIIKEFYSNDDELALINNYNRYLSRLNEDSSVYDEYLEYVDKVSEIKDKVKIDFDISEKELTNVKSIPTLKDIINFAKITIKTSTLSDEQALSCKTLYPSWESYIGSSLSINDKVVYQNKLYKVRQEVSTVLENQPPSVDTAALYEEICESHKGTLEDPIPYNNMELENGKYYSQNEIIYLCNRNTGIPVYNNLSDLINIYVIQV